MKKINKIFKIFIYTINIKYYKLFFIFLIPFSLFAENNSFNSCDKVISKKYFEFCYNKINKNTNAVFFLSIKISSIQTSS